MNSYTTKISVVKLGGSNSYLLYGTSGIILVDAGIKGSKAKLKRALEKEKTLPHDIKLIVVTHGHYDHVQGLNEIREFTQAPILVHERELENRNIKNQSTLVYRMIVGLMGKVTPEGESEHIINPEIKMQGEELDLGEYGVQAKIMHTPGHSPGSISIVTEDGQCVAGDTLFNIFPGSLYPIIVTDRERLAESYKKLEKEDCGIFYPGHGKPITKQKFEKKILRKDKFMNP
jgi:glyoxylase-like metal-dependent hydrolase (beta-lactamase superfamily II)